ncbi:MAG: hypothetical protein WBA39_29190 [Rivularia sp. (in: cyanobacteria)]
MLNSLEKKLNRQNLIYLNFYHLISSNCFGDAHFRVETGHAMRTPEAENFVLKIELTDSQRQQALNIVDKIFQIFTEWTYELLTYAQKYGKESAIENNIEPALMLCV